MHAATTLSQRLDEDLLQAAGVWLAVALVVQPAAQRVKGTQVYLQCPAAVVASYCRRCCAVRVDGVDDAVGCAVRLDVITHWDHVLGGIQQRGTTHARPGRAVVPGDWEQPPAMTRGGNLRCWGECAVVMVPQGEAVETHKFQFLR